ncbi:MAG TPA: ABC transporter permease subunit [Crenotrichaceae bacterium]|nr:ABC transporter permease subunit [Crenotrichaceae bacterium]
MDYFLQSVFAAYKLLVEFDADVWFIIWTSLKITLTAIVVSSSFAIPLGIWLALHQFPGKRLLHNTLNALMAVPTVMIGLILYGLFSRQGALGWLGLLYTPAAIVAGQIVLVLPILLSVTLSAVESGDGQLIPTLKSLGATTMQQVRLIIQELNLLIVAGIVLAFSRAIGEVGAAMMLGGNIAGLTRTMTTAIALETGKGEFERGLALGMMLLLIAFLLNGVLQWLQNRQR